MPATPPASIEEAKSYSSNNTPSGSSTGTSSMPRRVLLKRRNSRLRTPTVGVSQNVAEEVDSGPPRATKRRNTKKRMIALFTESDYPRRK